MKISTIVLIIASLGLVQAQTQPAQPAAPTTANQGKPLAKMEPLPEIYSLKLQIQEKERAERDAKYVAPVRQFVMADVDRAESDIATEACKEMFGQEPANCQFDQDRQTGKYTIGLKPGIASLKPKPGSPPAQTNSK